MKFNKLVENVFDSMHKFIDLKSLYNLLAPNNSIFHRLTYNLAHHFSLHYSQRNIKYQTWINIFDTLKEADFTRHHKMLDSLPEKPLISVIMPVYNPDIKFLEQAIQSVTTQVYPNWELCIADDASRDPKVQALITSYTQADSRIRAEFREENGHISAASNSALALASGEYIALLDHDDLLHPLALLTIAQAINDHPNSEIIYSDEDKITKKRKRVEPYFKSDFDYDLFLSQNMISHLGVYLTKTVRGIGGFRIGYEGSQDHDLALRVLERIDLNQIHHIPRVLYHWRISNQSAAKNVGVKPYAMEAGESALEYHLSSKGIEAEVEPILDIPGYRIHYAIPKEKPTVELIIYGLSDSAYKNNFIQGLEKNTHYQSLNINNFPEDSQNGSEKEVNDQSDSQREYPLFNNSLPENKLANLNRLISKSQADIIGIINGNCMDFSNNWLEQLLGFVCQNGIGAVSPKLLFKNNVIFSGGIIFSSEATPSHIFIGNPNTNRNYYFGWASLVKGFSALPAGCLLVKRRHLIEVGGFNEEFSSEASMIMDLCLKLKDLRLRNVMVPDVEVRMNISSKDHKTNPIIEPTELEYFLSRWPTLLKKDPAFNPNLVLDNGKPTINTSFEPDLDDRPA